MSDQVEIISSLQPHEFLSVAFELASAEHFWFRWRVAAFLRQLGDVGVSVEENWSALDVGCGAGVVRTQIEEATKWTIDAVDLDYNALKMAQTGRGRIMYYDIIERRPEFHEKYDALILFDVLEHIEHPRPFVEALLFHLKPGGFLFVNVPAMPSLYSLYDSVQGHFLRYDAERLRREFTDFPVTIKDVRYWGLTNVPLALARKIYLKTFFADSDRAQIYQQGFKLPNQFVNQTFLKMMRIETALLKKTPAGSSLLLAAQKSAANQYRRRF